MDKEYKKGIVLHKLDILRDIMQEIPDSIFELHQTKVSWFLGDTSILKKDIEVTFTITIKE